MRRTLELFRGGREITEGVFIFSGAPPLHRRLCEGTVSPDCFRFPSENATGGFFALFHTIRDMMTVILRIDGMFGLNPLSDA
jgi:hypothetical protein